MIKVETKLYLNDKEILNYFEELDLDVFKKKVYKDVEIHSMALRGAYHMRSHIRDVIKELEKTSKKTQEKNEISKKKDRTDKISETTKSDVENIDKFNKID
ncbi:hypothetical protein DRN69_08000 [Candidatus Pacearchaeota archaeon]|nr:MAG: hypothetical protein DRN69_08000 [Candidatus Pacearchaeota archaeon]